MNTKGNTLALGLFFALLIIVLSVSPVHAIVLRENVTGHAYIHSATSTYELTVPTAQVTNFADMFDYEKGAHYTMLLTEGSSIHMSAMISNERATKITIEAAAYMQIKATPDDSWTTIWSDSGKYDINAGSSRTAASDPIDATQFGWWQDGCQSHFCMGLKIYPTSNPSDWTYSAFSIWFMVSSGTSTTPPPTSTPPRGGDGTGTTTPGTPPEYSYSETLAFLDPLANALGISRIGVIVIIAVVILCLIGGLVHALTKGEKY